MTTLSPTVTNALAQYTSSASYKQTPNGQHALSNFARWSGRDRLLGSLRPQEMAEYGHILGGSGGSQEDTDENIQALKKFLSFCYSHNLTALSLAKHIKVRRKRTKSANQQKLVSNKIEITADGFRKTETDLSKIQEQLLTVAEEIRVAMADKDFRENAPLDAAREKQGMLDAQRKILEDRRDNAVIVNNPQKGTTKVQIGSTIRISEDSTGLEKEYLIVNPAESDPVENKISPISPVGRAMMNHLIGDNVVVSTPRGKLSYHIRSIT